MPHDAALRLFFRNLLPCNLLSLKKFYKKIRIRIDTYMVGGYGNWWLRKKSSLQ